MESSSPESCKLTYKETTFFGLLKVVGYKEFLNWSIFWAIIFTILLLGYVLYFGPNNAEITFKIANNLISALLGASAGIFGIVIAALTVTLSLFHQSLLPIMLEEKLLQRFLFPFWLAVTLWAVNLFLNIIILIFYNLNHKVAVLYSFYFEFFLFIYATFYTVNLTGLVIRLALQRAQIK